MRTTALLPIVASLAILASVSLAQDAPATKAGLLPIEPFAGLAVGDWWVHVAGTTSSSVVKSVVTGVADGKVTIREECAGKSSDLTVDAKGTTLRGFLRTDLFDETVTCVAEAKAVEGRTFACQKVTVRYGWPSGWREYRLWFSSEVKGGLVAREIEAHAGGPRVREIPSPPSVSSEVLAGFGTKDGKLWGKTAEEATKAVAPEKK